MRTTMRWRLALVMCSVLLITCASQFGTFGCSAILGINPGNPEPPGDAASQTPDSALPSIPDPCEHVVPVSEPTVDDGPTTNLPPFILAIEHLQVTLDDDAGLGVGLDLDGVCTCDRRSGTAHDGGSSCVRQTPRPDSLCDLDGGVDNALAVSASQVSAFFDITGGPNDLVKLGARTMLLELAQYNGLANDKDVKLGVMVSTGIRTQGCPTSVTDGKFWSPGWCGNDRWNLEASSVHTGGPRGFIPAITGAGYVNDHRLVINMSSTVTLPFSTDFKLSLQSAIFVGTLIPLGEDLQPRGTRPPTEKEKRLFRLTGGIVAGRIAGPDMLALLGTVTSTKDAGQLCENSSFTFIKQSICDAIDVTTGVGLDFDPGAACDAISTGFGFTASPALSGDLDTEPSAETNCHPGPNGDPKNAPGVTYHCP